jgi:hypothetical protein
MAQHIYGSPEYSIEAANNIVNELTVKHRALADKADDLAVQRRELSYAAHTGDERAKKKLDQLTRETVTLALEHENVASALVEANRKLNEAQAEAAREQQKENARKLRAVTKAFVELGNEVDELLSELATASAALKASVSEIHGLGVGFPSHAQLQSLGERALHTSLMNTLFQAQHVPPGERTTFAKLIKGWAATIERGVEQTLGETAKQEAA